MPPVKATPMIPFGDYAPDVASLGTSLAPMILNVVPQADGYGPWKSFQSFTSALGAQCRGYFHARNADQSITVFGATSTNLYKLNNTDFTWENVSRGGGPYSAVANGYHWQFVQFNRLIFATQANEPLQVFDLASPSTFTNSLGSPPQAAYIAIINRFLVLTGIVDQASRVQWCGLNSPNASTSWDNVTAQSNYQDLADGGTTRGVAGNDQFGVVFQDSAIRNMVFAPGSPVVFEIIKIADKDGAINAHSIVTAGDRVYFCSPQGFKFIPPGGYPTPIGREKIDRTFFADLDSANLQYFIGATDPTQTRVFWAYKSKAGASGLFDKVLCYDTALKKWAPLALSGEFMTTLARPGLTLEALDPIAPGAMAVTGAANNGSGLIRITVASTASLTTGDTRTLSAVGGVPNANGTFVITVISGTTFDLVGSTFGGLYTSGGLVGGVLDDLPFSLDDISLASLAQLSMVNSSHVLGFFSGDNMEATLETAEQDGQGLRFAIGPQRPITDSSDVAISIGAREDLDQATTPTYSTETTKNRLGVCPQRIDTRYPRARMRIPEASVWTYARGIQPEFRMTAS